MPALGGVLKRAVRAGQRRIRRRRIGAAAAATSFVGLAVLLTVTLPGAGGALSTQQLSPVATPSTVPTTAPVTPPAPAYSTPPAASPEELAQRASELAVQFNQALATAVPGWAPAYGEPLLDTSGSHIGWLFTATDPSTPLTRLSVSLTSSGAGASPDDDACRARAETSCTQRTLADGTVVISGLGDLGTEDADGVPVTSTPPFAVAAMPGRLIDARSVILGSDDTPGIGSVLPPGSPLTTSALEALVTSPELTDMPLP
ncbi:hypothetical protein [Kineococcus xinjiangensis]|uniref:hypothetical protein n=1 Tax=Kineococcus xinjiangensis TaxID=512762 RepID=UPI0011B02E34|nr:hypothetical protein [Kineococcus xinjiangensis]